MEDFGAPSLTLIHDTGVFELLNESFFSSVEDCQFFARKNQIGREDVLIVRITHLQHLLARKHIPRDQSVKFTYSTRRQKGYYYSPLYPQPRFRKDQQVLDGDEINKGISYVAFYGIEG